MSFRKSPGKGDQHRSRSGTPIAIGGGSIRAVAAPPIPDGKVRCPSCRNAVTPTTTGRLRAHRDLFDNPCPNRSTGDRVELTEVPEVVLPPTPIPPTPRRRAAPVPDVAVDTVMRRSPDGSCFDCGKRIPPGRRLCGRCYALGER